MLSIRRISPRWRSCRPRLAVLQLALLSATLLLAGCPDPLKKYTLEPVENVALGDGEKAARQAAPFADSMVRYLMGGAREGNGEFVLRVDFEPGGFAPVMNTLADVEALLVIMRDFPSLEISIEGHTDNAGDAVKNRKLSEWRANWVKQFLLERGIAEERVAAVGLGDADPVADNATERGREQNRRLVVRVVNYAGKAMNVRFEQTR